MKSRLVWIGVLALCLPLSGYFFLVSAGNKLCEKADAEMHTIAENLREYAKIHDSFPKDIESFLEKEHLTTTISYWPYSTEIKIYCFEDDTCNLAYLQVPFGPLAGLQIDTGERYFTE